VTRNSQLATQESFASRRILVTGHTGFKGSWLCEWLLSLGAEVHGYALDPQPHELLYGQLDLSKRISSDTRADIRDRARVREWICDLKPDFLFHLAAQPLVRLSYETPIETYEVNVMGTVHLLDALRSLSEAHATGHTSPATRTAAVMITTDKCYENREWLHGYREEDAMGGYDPYSSSKGCAELAIAAYRRSYFHPASTPNVGIASARAGNVIGGGDWAKDRIVPDCIRALQSGNAIPVRNKTATRPWQHVLEPLSGYLTLAARLMQALNEHKTSPDTRHPLPDTKLASAFNFGPALTSNRTVAELVVELLKHWPGEWDDRSDPNAPHEASKLNLATDKAFHTLGWQPRWDFESTIQRTANWYRQARDGADATQLTKADIEAYIT
jgi:CDP-glucose 4,6-dehydratase